MSESKQEKYLFETVIPREVESTVIEKRIENDKEIEVKSKVKSIKDIKVAIVKPNRKLYKEAELFYSKTLAHYLREGLMPHSLVAKRYANDGGPLTEAEIKRIEELRNELKGLEKQFFDIVPDAAETGVNVQKSDILIKINKINAEISSIQNAYSDIFDNTAEIKTRNDTIEWWSLFLIHLDEDSYARKEGEVAIYKNLVGDDNFEEKLIRLEALEEKNDAFYTEVTKRLSYLVSFWYSARVPLTLDDFKTIERLYLDSFRDYRPEVKPELLNETT